MGEANIHLAYGWHRKKRKGRATATFALTSLTADLCDRGCRGAVYLRTDYKLIIGRRVRRQTGLGAQGI